MSTPAPIAGRASRVIAFSVFRVVGRMLNGLYSTGTGFLHSGKVITAHHVVRDCDPSTLVITSGHLTHPVRVTNILSDDDHDLALLTLEKNVTQFHTDPKSGVVVPLTLPLLSSSTAPNALDLGLAVTTWGFPIGYTGQHPLLAAGHLSGFHTFEVRPGVLVSEFIINAAFNSGNSGGPLIQVETPPVGVIGVVVSKHAPVEPHILTMLAALGQQHAGIYYRITFPDGTTHQLSEGQLMHHVLEYLRAQTQLVIGYATPLDDLRDFLTANAIEPDLPDQGVRPPGAKTI